MIEPWSRPCSFDCSITSIYLSAHHKSCRRLLARLSNRMRPGLLGLLRTRCCACTNVTKPLSTRELKDPRVSPSELQLFATGPGSASDLAPLLRECAALSTNLQTSHICYLAGSTKLFEPMLNFQRHARARSCKHKSELLQQPPIEKNYSTSA
jgi:hypothetical protein